MNRQLTSPDLLKTKPHFEILDGLRGVAALAVVIFHFMEWVFPDITKNFIGHGFLAVDFFFCLSGFVIGYAYDNRMEKMGITEFFKSRLIRLHPLIVLSSVLGLVAFLFDPFATGTLLYDGGRLALLVVSSALLIPMPIMEDRFYNVFGLNAPAWSLFWEYVANIVYAVVLFRIRRVPLVLLTIAAAAGLLMLSYSAGNLLGGWSKDNWWHGGVRVAYSFCAGLLIHRLGWIIKNNLGFLGLTFLLTLAFIMPFVSWNWLAEALVVLFYFPLIVALGAGAKVSSGLKGLCKFSGDISYPLYMTHYAAIWMFGNYYTTYNPTGTQLILIVITGTIVLVAVAYLAMRFYDIPLRKYLTAKRQQGLKQ